MNETHDALRIWYKGNGYDTLFLDDGTPAYFIAAEVGIGAQRGLFVSPMCFLEGVSTAFETLARGWAYSGGTFFPLSQALHRAFGRRGIRSWCVYPHTEYPVSI